MDPKMEDEIVISGISGKFPECNNIEEFKQKLLEGIDFITEDSRRWTNDLYKISSPRSGKLKNLDRFDAQFFGVHEEEANLMDPQGRMLLEITYEALVDAGVNPSTTKGSNIGVIVGVTANDTLRMLTNDSEVTGYEITGNNLNFLANRISYTFDFNGPSYAIDTVCSSSLVAFEQAVSLIQNGKCNSAIVAGCNLLLNPMTSVQFAKLGICSEDGKCKSFDESGDGFVRAESIVVVYIQKSKQAKRIYATVLGAKTNSDGYKEQGFTYPSGKMQSKLIRSVYKELRLDPASIFYVEAHGTGTEVGDPEEVNSLSDIFCANRNTPLYIGSVKSNMGHSESASGLCSLAKVIISMETGIIPANLHFKNPNRKIPALLDGRIKVVAKNLTWNGGIIAINSFGLGGANAHIVLKSNPKSKSNDSPIEVFSRIVGVSGRTQEAVHLQLENIKDNRHDNELLTLISDLYAYNIPGHSFRGFIICDTLSREISVVDNTARPICFLYSGMGSQWPEIAKNLMGIKVFRESIERSSSTLRKFGIDLEELLTRSSEDVFGSALNCFVSITSIQIALTNILTSIGVKPDIIIGHSIGEVCCAYVDGGLTEKQTTLLSYFRGLAINQAKIPDSAMAMVDLTYNDVKHICPSDIYPVSWESENSTTISGPPDSIEKFVNKLKSENTCVKVINNTKSYYYGEHLASIIPILSKYLDQLIPNPKLRSSKWVSSSVSETEWKTSLAQMCSSEYYINNFISPVLFHQAVSHIPKNAIVIEIAPTDIFQSILRSTLGPKATIVSLSNKQEVNNVHYLLTSIGKIYNAGAQPQFMNLYGPIDYPVSRGTPMISPMVKWNHCNEMLVCEYEKSFPNNPSQVIVDLRTEKDHFLLGHFIDGRVLYPATGFIEIAWKAFAKLRRKHFEQMPVIIEDLLLLRATILPQKGTTNFFVNILGNKFEISEGDAIVATGKVYEPIDIDTELIDLPKPIINTGEDYLSLSEKDIYKELSLRGYDYKDQFCGIYQSDNKGLVGKLKWNNNWISYLDTVLQFSILGMNCCTFNDILLPTCIEKVIINPIKHLEMLRNNSHKEITVHMHREFNVIKSGSIEIRGLKPSATPRRPLTHADPILEVYEFVPYENDEPLTDYKALTILSQLVHENCCYDNTLSIAELINDNNDHRLIYEVKKILNQMPLLMIQASIISLTSVAEDKLKLHEIKHIKVDIKSSCLSITPHLIIMDSVGSKDPIIFANASNALIDGGFVLLEEKDKNVNINNIHCDTFRVVSYQKTENSCYILLRKMANICLDSKSIKVTQDDFSWLEPLQTSVKENEQKRNKIYLYSQGDKINGIVGLVNCLKWESGGNSFRSYFIQDKNAKEFSTVCSEYTTQLKKDLVHNILKDGIWGSFRHIPLDMDTKKPVKYAYVDATKLGDLSSFRWIENTLPSIEEVNKIGGELCSVYYSALNFRDVMLATGKLVQTHDSRSLKTKVTIGFEFSGISRSRRRLMGLCKNCLATDILTDPYFTWEIPNDWSLEEASTVPVVYITVYYSLIIRAKIKPGESVLIHAGAGGVGIAAINVALSMGCTVFTTVSNQDKRHFIKETFPQISDNHIGNSRDNSFEQMIFKETKGRGVDIVLNSLADEQLQASVRCLAKGGRFLELGKVDLVKNSNLDMSFFLKNTVFHGIMVDNLIYSDIINKQKTALLIKEGITNGIIKPLPRTIFTATDNGIEQAFRYLATGKQVGKVILKVRDEEDIMCQPTILSIPCTYMNPNKSYIVVGGLGGFGLELSKWLVSRRVTKLVLNNRSGIKTGYQSLCVRRWKDWGVTVLVSTADATTRAGAIKLLKQAAELGDIGGIFNLAAVLSDKLFENHTETTFAAACKPKIDVTKHLDVASRDVAPYLDYFVTFSSLACGRGNIGQTNYAFGNSAMECICNERKSEGLPGLSIQWGAVGDVGLVIENMVKNDVEILGTLPQRIPSCLTVLDYFLQQNNTVLSSFVLANKVLISADDKINLIVAMSNILGIKDHTNIRRTTTFLELGADSLMMAEARQFLQKTFDIHMSLQEIKTLTIDDLANMQNKC